jgi:drug/metabolite transporter (DMT)-like permease
MKQTQKSGVEASATGNGANLTRGYVIALVSSVFLSTTSILIRYLTTVYHMPPLALAFWRDALAGCSLLPVLALLRPLLLRLPRRHLFYLVSYGFVLASFNVVWTLSVALNGAAVSTVLAYCSVGFTALLGWWLLNERLDWAKLLAVALALGGCGLVSGALDSTAWQANVVGILTGILTGLCYAIYSLMGRSASQRGLNPWTTLFYTFSFAALFLLLLNLLPTGFLPGIAAGPTDLLWLGNSLSGWGILFLLAAGPTVAGFGLYNVSLGYLPSSVANLILTSEPVFTAIIAYFLLAERLNGKQLGGSVMILAGVVFLRISEGRLGARSQAKRESRIGAVSGD